MLQPVALSTVDLSLLGLSMVGLSMVVFWCAGLSLEGYPTVRQHKFG